MALAVISSGLTVTLELPSVLAIHASGQLSFLVRWKSVILCGRALFFPTVLYFPQPCSIFPNRALFFPTVLYFSQPCSIFPNCALFFLIGCSGLDKPTRVVYGV